MASSNRQRADAQILYHGSCSIISSPSLALGRPNNDFGRGFYCTHSVDMAREWACKGGTDGYCNKYSLDVSGLRVLNLLSKEYIVLNWMAVLLQHRTFFVQNPVEEAARDYVISQFGIDAASYDMAIGYRADDSYFSYARAFIANTLPLRCLSRAMTLGKLGVQVALLSEKGMSHLSYLEAESVPASRHYAKFKARDEVARAECRQVVAGAPAFRDDIFVMDILREEMKNGDPRLQ